MQPSWEDVKSCLLFMTEREGDLQCMCVYFQVILGLGSFCISDLGD